MMCFASECKHYNEKNLCKFFAFPRDKKILNKWIKLIRRADREPSPYSRICSCHFRDGNKKNLPTIYIRNATKMFPVVQSSTMKKVIAQEWETVSILSDSQPEPTSEFKVCPSATPGEPSAPLGPSFSSVVQEAENYFLKCENEQLKTDIGNSFSLDVIKENDSLITYYTGFPSMKILHIFLNLFSDLEVNYYYGWRVDKISRENQIFITLIKLRLNLGHTDLSVRFLCSTTTISNIVLTWIHVFHIICYKSLMSDLGIPSQSKNKACLPSAFNNFSNCRMVIDCTEVFCVVPRKSMNKQRLTYSHYKHRNTFKGLVGVAPNGVITFCSELYPGSTSDKKIVEHSKLLDNFVSGDLILADKGFLINDLLPPGVSLNIPPFLSTPQFTPNQILRTTSIARARIHVERAIRRVKAFTILELIPPTLRSYSSIIWQVCCSLTNWQYPIIKEVEMFYSSIEIEKT